MNPKNTDFINNPSLSASKKRKRTPDRGQPGAVDKVGIFEI
jgi:hypothetical protein